MNLVMVDFPNDALKLWCDIGPILAKYRADVCPFIMLKF